MKKTSFCRTLEATAPISEADAWIERHLETWAAWMCRRDSDGDLRTNAAGLKGFTHMDMDAAYDALDNRIAQTVNVCMDELEPAEHAAVYNRHGLAVFEFPRGNEEALYGSAKAKLTVLLRKRDIM